METLTIDLLNPKAKALLKELADLKLIRIREEEGKGDFQELLDKLRSKSEVAPSLEEITKEVEAVRAKRYED